MEFVKQFKVFDAVADRMGPNPTGPIWESYSQTPLVETGRCPHCGLVQYGSTKVICTRCGTKVTRV